MKDVKKRNKAKNYITFALYALMLKKDYESISVKEICQRANVSRMSFYRYYNQKDDIFVDYCDERFEEFYGEISKKGPNLTIREFTLEMFKYFERYRRQITILKLAKREYLLLDLLNSYARYIVANLQSDYLIEQKNNPMFAYFMAGGLFNVLMNWLDDKNHPSPEDMNNMLHQVAVVRA